MPFQILFYILPKLTRKKNTVCMFRHYITAVKYCILHNISECLTKNMNRQFICRRIDFGPCITRLHVLLYPSGSRESCVKWKWPRIKHSAFNTGNIFSYSL